MPVFKGPQKYVKKHKMLKNIKDPMIESAQFVFHYIPYEIHESTFTASVNSNTTGTMYYSYYYFDETQTRCGGRIYNLELPLQELKGLPATNRFEYTMNGYEMDDHEYTIRGPATFRITFTKEAADKLRNL